jgi:hypothetical protein
MEKVKGNVLLFNQAWGLIKGFDYPDSMIAGRALLVYLEPSLNGVIIIPKIYEINDFVDKVKDNT